MNRNDLHPDSNFCQDRKDYKIFVLLVLGFFILLWHGVTLLQSFFTTSDATDENKISYAFTRNEPARLSFFFSYLAKDDCKDIAKQPVVPIELRPLFFLPVSINCANRQLLESIPGIGPYLSDQIVTYRQEHGEFTQFQQLLKIPGIGPKKLDVIRKHTAL